MSSLAQKSQTRKSLVLLFPTSLRIMISMPNIRYPVPELPVEVIKPSNGWSEEHLTHDNQINPENSPLLDPVHPEPF